MSEMTCIHGNPEPDRCAQCYYEQDIVRLRAELATCKQALQVAEADLAAERERAEKWQERAFRRSQLMAMLTEERNTLDRQRDAAEQRAAQAEKTDAELAKLLHAWSQERDRAVTAERNLEGACELAVQANNRAIKAQQALTETERDCQDWQERCELQVAETRQQERLRIAAEQRAAQAEAGAAALRARIEAHWNDTGECLACGTTESTSGMAGDGIYHHAEGCPLADHAGREWLEAAEAVQDSLDELLSTEPAWTHRAKRARERLARWSAVRG